MKINSKLLFILFMSVLPGLTFAAYDAKCLADCFSTHHDCNYCSYQCYTEESYHRMPNYSDDATCPLQENNAY